jgi:siderophore synthetase component
MELTRWDRYVRTLLELSLEPLIRHGIGLEFDAQNTVVRICRRTKAIKGFAIRDLAGVKLHGTTLQDHGFDLQGLEATVVQDVHDVWDKMHHDLIQNHIGHLLDSLGLELHGWQIISFELERALQGEVESVEQGIYRHFVKETMPFKSLIKMRMEAPLDTVRSPLTGNLVNNLANIQASLSRSSINRFPTSYGIRVHGFVKYHWPLQRVCLHSYNQRKQRNKPGW